MGGQSARRGWTLATIATAAVVLAVTAQSALRALETSLSDQQIERALRLARRPYSDADRARFHSRYIFTLAGKPPVIDNLQLESIEVISEFRRTELIAEEHARINDTFGRAGLTEVRKALAPWRGRVVLVAHIRLAGPAANLVALPRVDVALDALPAAGGAVRRDISNDAALIGGFIETPFDAAIVGQTTRTAAVRLNDKLLGAARIDFRAID